MHFGNQSISKSPRKRKEIQAEQEEERKLSNFEYDEIGVTAEAYLNDKIDNIEPRDMTEAKAYIKAMKDYYTGRMREYVEELGLISKKLRKYEEILTKR